MLFPVTSAIVPFCDSTWTTCPPLTLEYASMFKKVGTEVELAADRFEME